MTTSAAHAHAVAPLARRLLAGGVGGIAGGLVFGVMMAMMGMLTTIAGMMHSSSPVVGFGIHLLISVLFGVGFGLLAGRWLTSWTWGLVSGAIWGIILWAFGPLFMMPIMIGQPVFSVGSTTLLSLMGHLVYGLVLAVVAVSLVRRAA